MNSIAKPAATVTTKNPIHSRAFKAAGCKGATRRTAGARMEQRSHNDVALRAYADVPVCLADAVEVERAVDDGAELACLCQLSVVGEIRGGERCRQ